MEREREIILPQNRLQKIMRGSQLMGSFSHVKISSYIEQSVYRSRKNLVFPWTPFNKTVFAVRFKQKP
jgi:hypothetical protein